MRFIDSEVCERFLSSKEPGRCPSAVRNSFRRKVLQVTLPGCETHLLHFGRMAPGPANLLRQFVLIVRIKKQARAAFVHDFGIAPIGRRWRERHRQQPPVAPSRKFHAIGWEK